MPSGRGRTSRLTSTPPRSERGEVPSAATEQRCSDERCALCMNLPPLAGKSIAGGHSTGISTAGSKTRHSTCIQVECLDEMPGEMPSASTLVLTRLHFRLKVRLTDLAGPVTRVKKKEKTLLARRSVSRSETPRPSPGVDLLSEVDLHTGQSGTLGLAVAGQG